MLDRIAKAKGDNIFITVTAARARAEAKKAEGRYEVGAPLSPLDGVPIGWKDLFDVAGTPTTAGSKLFGGAAGKDQPTSPASPTRRRPAWSRSASST